MAKKPCAGSIGRSISIEDGITVYRTEHNFKTFLSDGYQKQFCLKCGASTGWYTSLAVSEFGFAPSGYKSVRGF